jgi:hypothetical protein
MEGKILIGVAIFAGLLIVGFLRDRSFHMGRLAGAREAVHDLSCACSHHYEVKDQLLPAINLADRLASRVTTVALQLCGAFCGPFRQSRKKLPASSS